MSIDQRILDLFASAFQTTLSQGNELDKQIQQVKASLFDRDYQNAFGSVQNLQAYVVRWSPSRALSYSSLFQSLEPIVKLLRSGKQTRVMCIGGGAGAEIVALASIALLLETPVHIQVLAVDLADWSSVVDQISTRVNETWYFNHYAESLEDALRDLSLHDHTFSVKFINHDILRLPESETDLQNIQLITSMFTTNELFAKSKVETVKFLHSLSRCRPETLLLLVESAGSYSEIKVGTKVFPVQFLIHHALVNGGKWKLLNESDSEWYRVDPQLHYPLRLENMRYFFRLYQRC